MMVENKEYGYWNLDHFLTKEEVVKYLGPCYLKNM
jgi:hypothetical protein